MNKGIIYIIHPAELINTNRYKIGCLLKNNLDRCKNRYKLGTRYLCIMECNNLLLLEKKILNIFNKKFKLIAGREYFEGDENIMLSTFLEIINNYKLEPLINNNSLEPLINNNSLEPLTNINNESSSFETLTNIDNEETDDSLSTYSTDDNEIITYEDYLKNSNITKIIITNKELLTGYIRLNDKYHPWHHIKTNDEDLLGWLTYNIKYGNNCNYNKIINDICIKCYNTDITEYQFKYNEYLLAFHNKYTICDTKKLEIKYYDYDNEIDNNIIVYPDRGCIWSLTFNNFNNRHVDLWFIHFRNYFYKCIYKNN